MTDILHGPMRGISTGSRNEIQLDSIICTREEQLQRDSEVLLTQLITVDEEMGTDDITLLKFICRDHIGVAKLENMNSSLDIFNQLIKQTLITPENVNFLLECLGLIHRYDLIRKLGFDDIDSIKSQLSRFNRISTFRKLLLEVAEDLDESELSRLKFLLSGTVRKKRLQEYTTVLDLLVFMEKEHLLAHHKTDLLIDMLKSINRTDLVCKIQEYSGCQNRNLTENLVPTQNVHNHSANNTPHNVQKCEVTNTQHADPAIENAVLNRAGYLIPQNRDPVNNPVNRSPSAGTLSVSNSESDIRGNDITGQIPAELMTLIIETVAREEKWTDFAIELGFSNDEIAEYEQSNPDKRVYVRAAVDSWCKKYQNQKEIPPKLLYILEKLNFKTLKEELLKCQETSAANQSPAPEGETQGHRIAVSTERQHLAPNLGRVFSEEQNVNFTVNTGEAQSVYSPGGLPAQNQYVSYEPARPMQQNLPTGNAAEGVFQVMELEAQMNALNPRQNMMAQVLQQQYRTLSEPVYNTRTMSEPLGRINSQPVINTGGMTHPLVFHSSGVPVGQLMPELQIEQQQRAEVPVVNNQRTNPTVATDDGEQLPRYPMSKKPRGWCVIINNRDFYVNANDNKGKEMPCRSGTDVDAQSLQHVFETLGFVVRRRDNLTDTQMMQFLIDVAHNVDHTNFECFICCILTHGVLNHLYGTNGRLVSIKDLTSMFQANRCPTLVGKPKLFFLQACQGRDKMTGGEIGPNIEKDADVTTDSDKEMIPNEADFVIGYATVPGYVSFRSRTHGSWYIRKLCELLEKLSHKEDLLSILVQVNNEVSKANANLEDGIYKQTPAPLVTLRKKLYFL